jgi:hypothetical protein
LLKCILKIFSIEKEIIFTETYIEPGTQGFDDCRTLINPKNKNSLPTSLPVYTQVFSDRFPFHSNLSIFDLICNTGNKLLK